MTTDQSKRHAAAVRDEATRRLRRATAAVLAGSAALTGLFFGVAKASTHSSASTTVTKTTATKTTTTSGTVTAPTPSLVQNGNSSSGSSSSSQSQQSPAPSVAQSPPVVVSGGS